MNGKNVGIHAVTFDIFGTLIGFKDTFAVKECYRASYNRFVSKGLNLGSFNDFYHACIREWSNVVKKRFSSGKDTSRDTFFSYVLRSFGYDYNPSSSIILEAIEKFYRVFESEIKFSENILDLLRELREKIKIGIISDFVYPPSLKEVLKNTGIEKHVDCIVISSDVGWAKPSLQIFNKALTCLNVKPGNAVHVGDRLDSDIYGAKRMGMKAIWIRRTIHPDEPLDIVRLKADPDYEVNSIEEAFNVLFEII